MVCRWFHLLFNLLVQVLVGLPLEMVHGSTRIGTVYMAGVLAGTSSVILFFQVIFVCRAIRYNVLGLHRHFMGELRIVLVAVKRLVNSWLWGCQAVSFLIRMKN